MEPKKMYIDGEWVTGSMEKPFDVINPATGEVLAQVYESSVEDARRAIAAAKKSFYQTREWRDMDSQTRSDMILKIADLIDKYADELAMLERRVRACKRSSSSWTGCVRRWKRCSRSPVALRRPSASVPWPTRPARCFRCATTWARAGCSRPRCST